MNIVVLSKPGCPRCLLAKQKLKLLGLRFTEDSAGSRSEIVEAMGGEIPIILIDDEPHTYSAAMRRLKG